jgi:DNA repair protein RecN (Recombination protein N)
LLGLKRVLLEEDAVPVSVFDEVDAGVGGGIGEAIGEKLQAIASAQQHRQVLCITHLAQIAARADQHLVVEKGVEAGRTVSRVRALSHDDRVTEMGRMVGGKELTEATLRLAEDMLSRAQRKTPDAPVPPPSTKRVAKKKT